MSLVIPMDSEARGAAVKEWVLQSYRQNLSFPGHSLQSRALGVCPHPHQGLGRDEVREDGICVREDTLYGV